MKIFLAGIIQGSLPDSITPQDYRPPILEALSQAFPGVPVYDPIAEFPDSLEFTDERSSEVFFHLMKTAGEADLVVAYLPEASMGTAIEIWNAYHSGATVIAISPMHMNWVLKFCTDHICGTIEDFANFAASGGLKRLFLDKNSQK